MTSNAGRILKGLGKVGKGALILVGGAVIGAAATKFTKTAGQDVWEGCARVWNVMVNARQ